MNKLVNLRLFDGDNVKTAAQFLDEIIEKSEYGHPIWNQSKIIDAMIKYATYHIKNVNDDQLKYIKYIKNIK